MDRDRGTNQPSATSDGRDVSLTTRVEADTTTRFKWDTFLPCDPRRWLHKYVLFFFMCMLCFGRYYCYDSPTSLRDTIMEVMKIGATEYNILYTVYSWPNVIITIFGGFLLDRWLGVRVGTVIFSLLVCIGQFIFALGGLYHSFTVMAIGRFIFGLGGENLWVAQFTYTVMWFKETQLSMAFGFLLSVSRLGSTLQLNANQRMYDGFQSVNENYIRLGLVLMIGFGICAISLLCAIILGLFDRRAVRILEQNNRSFTEKISCKDIKELPLMLWLIIAICLMFYVTVTPFVGVAIMFLTDKYGFGSSDANLVSSFVFIISAVTCPFIGFLVDKTGFNLLWLNLGIIVTLVAHAVFTFLPHYTFIPYVAMFLMGLAYSLVATVLWPLVAFLVEEYKLGTAYGIMLAVQNTWLAIIINTAGIIVERQGYFFLEIIFQLLLYIALIIGILLCLIDFRSGCKLNNPACTRAKIQESRPLEEIDGMPESTNNSAIPRLGSRSRTSKTNPLVPSSASRIRNRYLANFKQIPAQVMHQFDHSSAHGSLY